jgi:hypothetical protein
MNALTKAFGGPVSSRFKDIQVENDLGAGIEASFGLMKFKGKVWTTSFKGEERSLMRQDGDGPMNSIDVVIVKAPKVKSKIWYAAGYVEGSTAAPDCWSTNGVVPDVQATSKQSPTCATCPKNVWGSRTTDSGKKGKACSDSKRIAIVPADAAQNNPGILRNEALGGPMLLRVPAATLGALASYGDKLKAASYPYQAVVTKIAFDPAEAYPTFVFTPVRPLTDEEADVIIELAGTAQVERILSEEVPVLSLPAPTEEPAKPLFEAPLPGQVTSPVIPAPVQAPAPPPPPPPPPAPPAPPAANPIGSAFGVSAPAASTNGAAAPVDLNAELSARLDALLG